MFAAAPGLVGQIRSTRSAWTGNALTITCLLLFMGAMGKSAQFLLHTWLPDAMEGPTPVSALIHAATMVTAGVFMVARLSPLFEMSPAAQTFVIVTGGTTCFFAATVGLVQNDIKRVIAYSTCSQLGYMFVALGCGGYAVGIFHLFTHAFFKALLFLGAGSVIHAVGGEQDMRKMGGLRTEIPYTFWLMVIGSLALVGFPFTAGYYSKDAIIEVAYASQRSGAAYGWLMTTIAAGLTSFYSFRLLFMTFYGASRAAAPQEETNHNTHHEPPSRISPAGCRRGTRRSTSAATRIRPAPRRRATRITTATMRPARMTLLTATTRMATATAASRMSRRRSCSGRWCPSHWVRSSPACCSITCSSAAVASGSGASPCSMAPPTTSSRIARTIRGSSASCRC